MNRQSTTVQGSHFHFPNPILARLTKRIGWELVRSTNAGSCSVRPARFIGTGLAKVRILLRQRPRGSNQTP